MKASPSGRLCLVIAFVVCGFAAEEDEAEKHVRAAQRSLQDWRLAEAEEHLTAALALPVSVGARAAIMHNLGFVFHQAGKYRQAETCYLRAINLWKEVHGVDELRMIRSTWSLAVHYVETGQFAKAERLGLESLEQKLSGRQVAERDLAYLLYCLGAVDRGTGNYPKAEHQLLRALAIWDRLEPQGIEASEVLNGLGMVYLEEGRIDDALLSFENALKLAEAAHAPSSSVAHLLVNIGSLHFRAHRLATAESIYQRAMAMAESSLGPEHPLIGQILFNYAVVLRGSRKRALADKFEKRGLAILRSSAASGGAYTVDVSDLVRR